MAIPKIVVINGRLQVPFPAGTGLQVVNGELTILEFAAEADILLMERHTRGMGRGVGRGAW